jgi:cytochrome c553
VTDLSADVVRQIIGSGLSEEDARALADWYANLSGAIAAFPGPDLKAVEPPLRSVAGPHATESAR